MPTNNELLLQALNDALLLSQAIEQYKIAKAEITTAMTPEEGQPQTKLVSLSPFYPFTGAPYLFALDAIELPARGTLNTLISDAVTTKLVDMETQLSALLATISKLSPAPAGG